MYRLVSKGFWLAVCLLALLSGGCHRGGGSSSPDIISVSGSVGNGDVAGAAIALKNSATGETVSSSVSGEDGQWTLSVERVKLAADTDFILTATHPVSGRVLRSAVSGSDILSAGYALSSNLTVISAYSEAAFLVAKAGNGQATPVPFMKYTLKLTGLKMPRSTGNPEVDALARWISGKFNGTGAESGIVYSVQLLAQIIRGRWPAVFVAGSPVTISFPQEFTELGATVSVTDFEGPEDVTVSGSTLTVSPAASEDQGEAVLKLSLGGTDLSLTLPVITLNSVSTYQETLLSGSTTPVDLGRLTIKPGAASFLVDTAIEINELDIDGFAGATIGGVTVTAAFNIELAGEPGAPVQIIFTPEEAPEPDSVVLIHIDPATKVETYIFPDSYDETSHSFTFTVNGFSPILIGTLDPSPTYSTGSVITVSDLENDSANALAFMRQISDFLGHEQNLAVISTANGEKDIIAKYLVQLSSKALSSFMALPATHASDMAALKTVMFKPQPYSLSTTSAFDAYWSIRSSLMKTLYRVTNMNFKGFDGTELSDYGTRQSKDIESDIQGSILGQRDANGRYHLPMMAYRVLKLGCTLPDNYFRNVLDSLDSKGLTEDERIDLFRNMAAWIEGYIAYKTFTAPKVYVKDSLPGTRDSLVLGARNFFGDSSWADFAGLWLGGSYPYAEDNSVSAAAYEFAAISDMLGDWADTLTYDADLLATAQTATEYPLGSSMRGRKWADKTTCFIPPEVSDEISVLENWRLYLLDLIPSVSTWYRDSDGDGYGDAASSVEASEQPSGYVVNCTDQDDTDATVYPGAPEICGDTIDNDLDGTVDEGCGSHYKGTENTFTLLRKSNSQFLLPVDVGGQTLNLLVDTGSDAIIVFADRLSPANTARISNTSISKRYVSITRTGFLAQAQVRIGAYFDDDMNIMVVTSPTSDSDPSLTAKGADGIIGLRRTQGLALGSDDALLDAPFNTLQPAVNIFELNLPPTGTATLSLGKMEILDRSRSSYIFKAKTYTFSDPVRPIDYNFADLQVPFRAKSRYGEVNTGELDVLFDSGAVSKLVLDTEVAKALGYDPTTGTWQLDGDSEIEFNLVGPANTVTLYPKFKISEISVAPFRRMGVTYEAVLGIDRWQHYVIGFSYVDYQSEGPDGTILMLFRPNMAEAFQQSLPGQALNYKTLSGLNSLGDDRFPTADEQGNTVAFQTNRPDGMGGWDIGVWKKDEGILTLPGLNSTADDADPSLSADGRYLIFHSNRSGGAGSWDIYLYDLQARSMVALPGVNTESIERTPTISADGRFLVFRSERDGGAGDSDIYMVNRETGAYVPLPGLNSDQGEYDPVVNADGTLIAFDYQDNDAEIYDPQSYLYDVTTHTLDTLAALNSTASETDSVISPDGTYYTLQTNRFHEEMGLYNRDFMVFNRSTERYELLSGLNSEFDEDGICFTGDSRNILFHSSRPGGKGGSDIYFYSLDNTSLTDFTQTRQDLPAENIDLTCDETSGVPTLKVTTAEGVELTLLVDTGLSGIILFEDRAPLGNRWGGPVSVTLPYGTLYASEQIYTQVHIGNTSAVTKMPVIASQDEYDRLVGRTDLPRVDGVIGFLGMFQNEFAPKLTLIEYSFIDGSDLNLDLEPGLSIGAAPMTDIARGQGEYMFDTAIEGYTDPVDPYNDSYTDMGVSFIAQTDTGVTTPEGRTIMLSSVLEDTLILDFEAARDLGYSSITGWGDVTTVRIIFANDDKLLPLDAGLYPVNKIQVTDLSGSNCDAVLSADRWTGDFIVSFSTIDFQSDGPSGTVSFLQLKDVYALQGDFYGSGRNYISLPGLNSSGDDIYSSVSIDGQTLAFQSNRNGHKDVFVYRIGQGLLTLPGLNSTTDDSAPTLTGDGRFVAFQSDRSGNYDVYLYDIREKTFISLPGLNTEYLERQPTISSDGKMLAYRSENPDTMNGGSDIFLYSLVTFEKVSINGAWLNTGSEEYFPLLNGDGTLISFIAFGRDDTVGDYDVYLYDLLAGHLVDLPDIVKTEGYEDGMISPDGAFLSGGQYWGSSGDIYLLERSSGELIYLPGLNTPFEEASPIVTPNAQFISFESDRPGGQGGWDIYLYQRDETDTNSYTVAEAFDQGGYVTGADGGRVSDETVYGYDRNGKLIGTTITDGGGNFTLTVPQGTLLGITFETRTGGLTVVTDDVGDDTYVPDFEAGNLKFGQVWIEDKAQAGLPSTIRFDIETTAAKYNTSVTVYLKAGNPGDIDLSAGFEPDYQLTTLTIDKLGFRGEMTDPVIKSQNDRETSVTYMPGTNNMNAHVEHTFTVPQGIPDGLYTAVFAINTFDVTTEDDEIQGEDTGDLADNFVVASASTIIGNPDKPNLRILSSKLYTNSFELPASVPLADPAAVPESHDLSLNLEVESMAQDTSLPVAITFELDVNGVKYPMAFSVDNGFGGQLKIDRQTYEETCRPEDREGYPDGDRCASLYRQEQTGKTYTLYMNADAYNALKGIKSDITCHLVVTMDPDNTIEEYEDNKADNVIILPVQFLAPEPATKAVKAVTGTYENIFNFRTGQTYGNDDFNIGYEVGPTMDYKKTEFNGMTYPYATTFNAMNDLNAKVFGYSFTPLSVGPRLNFDCSSEQAVKDSYFDYGVYVFGVKIWGQNYSMPDDYMTKNELSLWDSKDEEGNERFAKRVEKKKEKTFNVGPVPITVSGALVGELGIRGEIKYQALNKLVTEAGPFASLVGTVEGGLGVPGFCVGVGVELTLMDISLKLTPSVQILPEVPIALLEFRAPIVLSTLQGEAYLFARAFFWSYKYTVIDWDGYTYEINLFPLWYRGYGATNLYKSYYYPKDDWTGTTHLGGYEGLLHHDWGYGGPAVLNGVVDYFSAFYEGYFDFPGADEYVWGDESADYGSNYTFHVDSDDYLSILLDGEFIVTNNFGDSDYTEFVSTGFHKLMVYYKELHSPAYAKVYWTRQNQFAAFYYNNTTLTGDPVYFESTERINYKWNGESPKEGLVNADNFSIRFEGDFTFPKTMEYQFIAKGDDSVKVYVDGNLVLDNNWVWWQPTSGSATVTEGSHHIKVEYIEVAGWADISLTWAPKNTFVGRYWNNRTRSGNPVKTSDDSAYFQTPGLWEKYFKTGFGNGNPPGVNYDNFSAVWEGAFYFDGGEYEFVPAWDDEFSFWIDGNLMGSYNSCCRADLITVNLSQGWHTLRMSFVEYTHNAVVSLKWGKKTKNIVTEIYGKDYDASGRLIPMAVNRRTDMNSNWGHGAPTGDVTLDGNNYTVIWEGDFDFNGAPYEFGAAADDKVIVYVDNVKIIESYWSDWRVWWYETIPMNAGTHHVKVVFNEYGGGAWANVKWAQKTVDRFHGMKFDGATSDYMMDVNPVGKYIAYDWGGGTPGGRGDDFRIIWTGVFNFDSDGNYTFQGSVDDDLVIYIDNVEVYHKGCCGAYSFTKYLSQGQHSIKAAFWEAGGGASVSLSWNKN